MDRDIFTIMQNGVYKSNYSELNKGRICLTQVLHLLKENIYLTLSTYLMHL